jgi:hypothetical protein
VLLDCCAWKLFFMRFPTTRRNGCKGAPTCPICLRISFATSTKNPRFDPCSPNTRSSRILRAHWDAGSAYRLDWLSNAIGPTNDRALDGGSSVTGRSRKPPRQYLWQTHYLRIRQTQRSRTIRALYVNSISQSFRSPAGRYGNSRPGGLPGKNNSNHRRIPPVPRRRSSLRTLRMRP